jgi:hypothetical protein
MYLDSIPATLLGFGGRFRVSCEYLVNPTVADGVLSPSDVPAQPVTVPELSINGGFVSDELSGAGRPVRRKPHPDDHAKRQPEQPGDDALPAVAGYQPFGLNAATSIKSLIEPSTSSTFIPYSCAIR